MLLSFVAIFYKQEHMLFLSLWHVLTVNKQQTTFMWVRGTISASPPVLVSSDMHHQVPKMSTCQECQRIYS